MCFCHISYLSKKSLGVNAILTPSNLIEKPPTNYKIPTPPSDFKYKIWKLENEKIKSVLVLDSLGEYTYNNKEIFAINWSQTTLTFNLPDNLDEILLLISFSFLMENYEI